MNFPRIRGLLPALAGWCALLLAVPAVWAQQDATPSPAQGADQSASSADSAAQNAPGPVDGVEAYRFPGPSLGHSFFVPRFSLQQVYNTNGGYAATPGASQALAVTSITAGLSLQWVKRVSTLSLDYSAGGLIYNPQNEPDAVVQQLGLMEEVKLRRWDLTFGENFSYLPNSAFALGGQGYLGGGISGLSGIGSLTGFNPSQLPTQTILSPNVSELSSASNFQAQYFLNGTSSINGSVVVGFLHYFGSDLLNTRSVTARFGYDKSLTPRDTISFSYQALFLDYPSGISGFTSHYIQMSFRRIITGRLHLSVSAGPSITHFSMTGQTPVPGGTNLVGVAARSSLDYALRNGSFGAQYSHGVGGGSGFLIGAVTDQLSGNFSHLIGRTWRGSLTGGFAHNSAFQQTAGTAINPSAAFNFWFAGGALSRPIGRYSSLSFSYNASRQTSNATVCANSLACGPIALTQVVGVTFNWSTRPYRLE